MKRNIVRRLCGVGSVALMCLVSLGRPIAAAAQSPGAGSTIVHSKFGGQIFGFDIDQNGTEGVLSESQTVGVNKFLVAVETFDQASGKILDVVSKLESKDDFL